MLCYLFILLVELVNTLMLLSEEENFSVVIFRLWKMYWPFCKSVFIVSIPVALIQDHTSNLTGFPRVSPAKHSKLCSWNCIWTHRKKHQMH